MFSKKGCMYYLLRINHLFLHLVGSLAVSLLPTEFNLSKVWQSTSLTVGWPSCPGLPGLSWKPCTQGTPSVSVQTGTVGHSVFGISSLTAHPSSFSSVFFCIECSIYIQLLVPQAGHSLSCLPAFVHAVLCQGAPLPFCGPRVWFPSGIVC